MTYKEAEGKLKEYGQDHLLRFFDQLDEKSKTKLLNEIEDLDLNMLTELFNSLVKEKEDSFKGEITDIPSVSLFDLPENTKEKYWDLGMETLASGKVAVMLLAGGQGTRLKYDGPKGTYNMGLPSGKTIFQIHAERIKNISERAGNPIPWYIMTSPGNNDTTSKFFKDNNYFGLNPDDIKFFIQTTLPSMDEDGKILLSAKDSISLNPDGGGGCFTSLSKAGLLSDMKKRGVEYVFLFGVDNVLARVADPYFIGFAKEQNLDISSKSVLKKYKNEKVGVFAKKDGMPTVIEYTEIPESLLEGYGDDDFPFRSGNILTHLLKLSFIEKCVGKKPQYHVAHKEISYIDQNGDLVKPPAPNAYKYEAFYFDLFKLGDGMSVLNVNREEEFSPVKNLTGVDSKDSAIEMIINLHKKWLLDKGIVSDKPVDLPFDKLIYGNECTKEELEDLIK
ncbi:MAG: UDPGP type 1 family protein [Clostridiaceae bacterium]